MFNENELLEAMRKGVVVVVFKKVDGTVREMQCTLAPYLLPESKGTGRTPNNDVMVVFDLEAEAWRSFRKDSIIETFILE